MDCENKFQNLKNHTETLSTLAIPYLGEPLYLYLVAMDTTINAVLVQDNDMTTMASILYLQSTLHDAKMRYQPLEKLSPTLITTARRLHP